MTIREYILSGALAAARDRLERLSQISAPAVLISSQQKAVSDLEAGNLKISGDLDTLEDEFLDRVFKTGRGGKQYIQINGNVNFFPNAKYGPYISRA